MLGKKFSRKLLAASLAIGAFTFTPQFNGFNFISNVQAAKQIFKPVLTAKDQLQKAINLYDQGKYQEAFKYFDMAIKMDPNMAEAYECRGDAYLKFGEISQADSETLSAYNKAIDDYNKAVYLDKTNAATYYKKIAVAYYKRGVVHSDSKSYDAAIDDLNKALEFDPTYAPAYFKRGFIYGEIIKKYHVAIVNYYGAIYFDSNNAEYYTWRGRCYQALRQTETAISDFSKAIELNPSYWRAYKYRSECYRALGETEKANADSVKAQIEKANADNAEVMKLLQNKQ